MSEVKVNKISPRTACGTVTLGDSGDTFTIPSGATITNAGTASGFGATGETSWDTTVKTTGTFTATAGVGYFLNTTGGIITVNLAAGTAGDSVALADYAGTWQTNNVTVSPNGSEFIGGVNADVGLATEGQSVTFVYIDGTQGWVNVLDSTSNVRGSPFIAASVSGACNTLATAPCCANTKIATFLGPGTFTVSAAAVCAANNLVSYMVVAGGGGGASRAAAGGGGGGYREGKSPVTPYTASPLNAPTGLTVSATPYAIVVGGGGAGGSPPGGENPGVQGVTSSFSTISSAGGGRGNGAGSGCNPAASANGGSGGGAGPVGDNEGLGNQPPVSPSQGNPGGGNANIGYNGSGGGGAGGCGANATPSGGGAGGSVTTSSISALPTAYAGGGGGSSYFTPNPGPGGAGTPTSGAGGPGTSPTGAKGGNGVVNTGGGAGAGSTGPANPACGCGGNGGSGVVIIRYKFQ